jgi:hypothetical protein
MHVKNGFSLKTEGRISRSLQKMGIRPGIEKKKEASLLR